MAHPTLSILLKNTTLKQAEISTDYFLNLSIALSTTLCFTLVGTLQAIISLQIIRKYDFVICRFLRIPPGLFAQVSHTQDSRTSCVSHQMRLKDSINIV